MIVVSSAEMSTEERDGGSKTWLVERDVIASDRVGHPPHNGIQVGSNFGLAVVIDYKKQL